MSGRRQRVLAALLLAASALTAILVDASWRREARDRQAARHEAVMRVTGLPDLALSSSARWLRHPSQAEAGAPFSDLPASLDVDPAGALLGPPRAILRVPGVRPVIRARRSGAPR